MLQLITCRTNIKQQQQGITYNVVVTAFNEIKIT